MYVTIKKGNLKILIAKGLKLCNWSLAGKVAMVDDSTLYYNKYILIFIECYHGSQPYIRVT